jgi:uncharacterized protein
MSNNHSSHNSIFRNPKGLQFDLDGVIEGMRTYIMKHPQDRYELVIGTDSKMLSETKFVTSLVLRRFGNGGIFYYAKIREKKSYTLRDRIWRETMLSITLAEELRGRMKDVLGEDFFWNKQIEFQHIHLDVGINGPTKDLVDGVKGIVKGYGFKPVIKPDAYGAFVVADLYT